MFLLVTKNEHLHSFYEELEKDGVYYLAYTDDKELAEMYAHQFVTTAYKVYYIPVSEMLIHYIKTKWRLNITPLRELQSGLDGEIYVFSEAEMEQMDEMLSDGADTEFDDIRYCLENLKRFTHKKIRKVYKTLSKFYEMMTEMEEEQIQEYVDSVDIAEHYHFLADRLGLFGTNYQSYLKK